MIRQASNLRPQPWLRLAVLSLLLSSFLLQSLIPVGYMPASLKSGSLVELCPEGVSAAWMMTYLGHDHAHHNREKSNFQQCDLGGGLAASAVASQSQYSLSVLTTASVAAHFEAIFVAEPAVLRQRARAPPIHSRFKKANLKLI